MSNKVTELESNIDGLLKDPMLKQFAADSFEPSEFIASQLTSNNVADLWKIYTELMKKDKLINGCLEMLVEEDPQFFENQFTMPSSYGVT